MEVKWRFVRVFSSTAGTPAGKAMCTFQKKVAGKKTGLVDEAKSSSHTCLGERKSTFKSFLVFSQPSAEDKQHDGSEKVEGPSKKRGKLERRNKRKKRWRRKKGKSQRNKQKISNKKKREGRERGG